MFHAPCFTFYAIFPPSRAENRMKLDFDKIL